MNNPFAEISPSMPPAVMKTFVIIMILLVVAGTLFDIIHKKSAKYFFDNWRKSRAAGGEKTVNMPSVAVKTLIEDVAASGEFCNRNRRIAHLLTMYGFIVFVITTLILVFSYSAEGNSASGFTSFLWHLGALSVCAGGYWFWFFIRVDVAAEGHSPFRLVRADLFVVSLVACTTFALIWSFFQAVGAGSLAMVFYILFMIATFVLFAGIPWSKFSHMFFKPAAAMQKRVAEADGTRGNLPPPADVPELFSSVVRSSNHY